MMDNCYFTSTFCTNAKNYRDIEGGSKYYDSEICGRYEISNISVEKFNKQKAASYLYYHKDSLKNDEYYLLLTDELKKKYLENDKRKYSAILLTPEVIENWYPKNFYEKIDKILLLISTKLKFEADYCTLSWKEIYILFFMISQEEKQENIDVDYERGFYFIQKYLKDNKLVNFEEESGFIVLSLTVNAWSKIYDLQKYNLGNKDVFIAMKYRDNDEKYDAICTGITNAGYQPIRLDKEEYLGQMIPEMLFKIEHSKFMVVDYSDSNRGAYFESGYAYGLRKAVIPICSSENLKDETLHFDIQQLNMISFKDLKDLSDKLEKRIKATIK